MWDLLVCAEGEAPRAFGSVDAAIANLGNYSRNYDSPNDIWTECSNGSVFTDVSDSSVTFTRQRLASTCCLF